MAKHQMTVAEFITRKLAESGKSQKDVAAMLGYDKPNVITMFKQGRTKLPVTKVGPMARALDVEPSLLLRLVMQEYMPETWDAIHDMLGQQLVTENELEIIEALRHVTQNHDPKLREDSSKKKLVEFGKDLLEREPMPEVKGKGAKKSEAKSREDEDLEAAALEELK